MFILFSLPRQTNQSDLLILPLTLGHEMPLYNRGSAVLSSGVGTLLVAGCPGCGAMAHARQQKEREYSQTARRMVDLLNTNCEGLSEQVPLTPTLTYFLHSARPMTDKLWFRASGSGCLTHFTWTMLCSGNSPIIINSLCWYGFETT